MLANRGTGITSGRVSAAELAQIVRSQNPRHRRLFDPLDSGVWIRVRGDTVRSLDRYRQ